MQASVANVLDDLRPRLETLYGRRLVRLVLFGSQAREEAEPGSDIDLLVVLRGTVSPCHEIERTIEDVAAVSLEHGVTVSCVFVSDEEYQRRRTPLLLNVRREGVSV
jgi:predicted nucleotidyltransferase